MTAWVTHAGSAKHVSQGKATVKHSSESASDCSLELQTHGDTRQH